MPKISDANVNFTAPSLRHSEHINRRKTQTIFRAFDFAEASGSPLNTYVVVNFPSEIDANHSFKTIRHKYRDWLNYRTRRRDARVRPAYVFTFESPDGHTHVNWVLHVPPDLEAEFSAKLPKWATKARGTVGPFDIAVQQVTTHPKSLAKYIVKGTDPAYVDHFYLRKVHAPQGWFRGIRAAVSTSLDKTARASSGFRPSNARPSFLSARDSDERMRRSEGLRDRRR